MKTKAKDKDRVTALVSRDLKKQLEHEAVERDVWPAAIVEEALVAHLRNSAKHTKAASAAN